MGAPISASACWMILLRRGAEEFLEQVGAAGDAEFFGQHAERVFRSDKVDAGDAGVGFKGAECLAGEDCAGSAGDGEGKVHRLAVGWRSGRVCS